MTKGFRSTGFYGIAGVLLASVIIIGFVAGNNLLVSGKGTLSIHVMDKPTDLEKLYLEIDWVKIQNQEDGTWTSIEVSTLTDSGSLRFDLLSLQETSLELVTEDIDPGSYSKVWLHILKAEAVFTEGKPSDLTEVEDEEVLVPLNVPSDVLKVFFDPSFVIQVGKTTNVLIDLQPVDLDSIAISNSPMLNLRPVIKAVITE